MKMFLIFLFSLVMLLCGCSPVETAGGVSEETNSVSGVLVAADGNFARNVVIHARHSAKSDQLFVDTTDENGAFGFSIKEYGEYVLSSHKAGQAIYETFVYTGSDLKMSSKMTTVKTIQGNLVLDGVSSPEDAKVGIPGTDWVSSVKPTGYFVLSNLPLGTYNLTVSSPDRERFDDAEYTLVLEGDSYWLNGPLPRGIVHSEPVDVSVNSKGVSYNGVSEITLPMIDVDYKIQYVWTMDSVLALPSDSGTGYYLLDDMGHETETVFLYEPEFTEGVDGKAIRFVASDYAAVDTSGFLDVDSLTELSIEGFFKFNNPEAFAVGEFQKNILSKRGDDYIEEMIGVSLISGKCGAVEPRLAFYSVNVNNPTCGYMAVSQRAVPAGEWIYVVLTWRRGIAKIYQNGVLTGRIDTGLRWMENISKPLYIGGDGLDFEMDDVRFGFKEISSAEVLYRYYKRLGGQL